MVRAWVITGAREVRASRSPLVAAIGATTLFVLCAAIGDALARGHARRLRHAARDELQDRYRSASAGFGGAVAGIRRVELIRESPEPPAF